MKKIIALVLCLAVVFSLSVSAFAKTSSPEAPITVIVREGSGSIDGNKVTEDKATSTVTGKTISMSADDKYGKFNSWSVYLEDGTKATEGVNFKVVSGSLTDKNVTIEFLSGNLIIAANYNGTITNPLTAGGKEVSPKTADMSMAFVAIMLAAGAAFAFSSKKVFSK